MDRILYATSTISAISFIYIFTVIKRLRSGIETLNSLIIVCNFLGGNKEKRKLKYFRNIWHLARDSNLAPPKITRFVNQ